jgi:threonine dehydrogenase-like Zn-dependent dehydrogenase
MSTGLPHPNLPADVVVLGGSGLSAAVIASLYRSRGAKVTLTDATHADVAVIVNGGDGDLEQGLQLLVPGGTLVIVGGENLEVPSDEIVLSELDLHVISQEALNHLE